MLTSAREKGGFRGERLVLLVIAAATFAVLPGCGGGCGVGALRPSSSALFSPQVLPPQAVATAAKSTSRPIKRPSETPTLAARPGFDLQNLYIFPSSNPANVVIALTLHPAIPPLPPPQSGQPSPVYSTIFDPNALFNIKIDNTGDFVEDLLIQAVFNGNDQNQRVQIIGPYKPSMTGTVSSITPPDGPSLPFFKIDKTFHLVAKGITGFAGMREDPTFIDLNAFFSIFPDRANPIFGPMFTNINGQVVSTTPANPNQPELTSFRSASTAQDIFQGLNVLAIVLDLPRASLVGPGEPLGVVHVWATSADPACNGPRLFTQLDREGRPFETTLLSTVANNRHQTTDTDNPTDDKNQLSRDIQQFMLGAAGRSQSVTNALISLLVPDVMTVDLSQAGPAAFLGVETQGATGGKFGGRKLTDDVVDTLLGLVFGNGITSLGLAPDDGAEVPALTTDHVGPGNKHFLASFPYLGDPQ